MLHFPNLDPSPSTHGRRALLAFSCVFALAAWDWATGKVDYEYGEPSG